MASQTVGLLEATARLHSRGAAAPHLDGGGTYQDTSRVILPSLISNSNHDFYLVFGRFPAELGPETRSNGSGSTNGAERNKN